MWMQTATAYVTILWKTPAAMPMKTATASAIIVLWQQEAAAVAAMAADFAVET
jgi:hypothetical protein